MSSIKFEIIEKVAKITLNRPEVLNSFNMEMAILLQEYLDECIYNQNIRAIYITGEGRGFFFVLDLSEVVGEDAKSVEEILKKSYNPIVLKIRNLEKPVIAAVNGVAAGAGANIALACDIVLASENASFVQAFSKIGLIPDSGGTFFLPRLVGMAKATAMMFLGNKVSAKEAADIGMIYSCVNSESLENEAMVIATTLSEMPTKAIGLTKRGINRGLYNDLENQLQFEESIQKEASESHDYKEGVEAFLEKRKPVFLGR
ncbi:MAG: enoyl-CoA hydratase-related protein [Candidatus Kapabacteria bacterium]|nr:enoyl-CoA hydratase-related protein [Candidatus Kapabacteria bacterium]